MEKSSVRDEVMADVFRQMHRIQSISWLLVLKLAATFVHGTYDLSPKLNRARRDLSSIIVLKNSWSCQRRCTTQCWESLH